ncbi:ATP-binding protein [Terrimonas ferruginea]|uniref:PorY family sensor histidine kinase n=1 Tax=Terrimonas ferruginea TaxID=249 RepID=UPI0004049049|nr:ATP-binding protein [Terrimonas ferruginea]
MKLLHRSIAIQLPVILLILCITGTVLYFGLRKEVTSEMNEQLELEAELVFEELTAGRPVHHPSIQIDKIAALPARKSYTGDTLIYDFLQKKQEGYHYLASHKTIGNQHYRVKVMTTYIGWGNYFKNILLVFILTAVLLAAAGIVVSYYLNRRLWKPFFYNLEQLRSFSVSQPNPIHLQRSDVQEFSDMQHSLKELADRSQQEYIALREFTENASHEIQTPLSIVRVKLDKMSQMDIPEEMASYIEQANAGIDRLSKLNKNLLLLARIDNNAFADKIKLRLDTALEQLTEQLTELFESKKLVVKKNTTPVTVNASAYLCEVLLSNLLSNAFKYAETGSTISIQLNEHKLRISNPGKPLTIDNSKIFQRFIKGNPNASGAGLGLAIVQQICKLESWKIDYTYVGGQHEFEVIFGN